jgi:carotenoid cleavage dioxygenase
VCRIILPERFCSGTHSIWANGDDIGMGPNTVLAA